MLMNGRDNCVGVVVEQGNNISRTRRVADPGVAAEVAEPQDRFDPLGDATRNAALQNSPAGIAAEVGLDQRSGNARQRRGLHRERKKGHEPA